MIKKIITWNVNGYKSVCTKGFYSFVEEYSWDFINLQEIKSSENDISGDLFLHNYFININASHKRGRSGVATISKLSPIAIEKSIGHERFDKEGRFLRVDFNDFVLINLYLPHGKRDKTDLGYKLEVYVSLLDYLDRISEKNIILVGDFNIAHGELDLANYKNNKNNTMFTESERLCIDRLLEIGFVDAFRLKYPELREYTWWPYAYDARYRNIGWRIDYAFVSKKLSENIAEVNILNDVHGSDHCPLSISMDIPDLAV